MQVTHWPKDEYGHFYNGDSYIILNTYKKPDSDVSLSILSIHWENKMEEEVILWMELCQLLNSAPKEIPYFTDHKGLEQLFACG